VSKLRSIAEQKIWLHWLMWFVPFVSWVTCFVSAALIRNPKPLAIGLGVSFVFGFLGGMSNESSLVYIGAILGSAIGAALTHVEIQRARNQLLAKD
jgi:hypothetical protein